MIIIWAIEGNSDVEMGYFLIGIHATWIYVFTNPSAQSDVLHGHFLKGSLTGLHLEFSSS